MMQPPLPMTTGIMTSSTQTPARCLLPYAEPYREYRRNHSSGRDAQQQSHWSQSHSSAISWSYGGLRIEDGVCPVQRLVWFQDGFAIDTSAQSCVGKLYAYFLIEKRTKLC